VFLSFRYFSIEHRGGSGGGAFSDRELPRGGLLIILHSTPVDSIQEQNTHKINETKREHYFLRGQCCNAILINYYAPHHLSLYLSLRCQRAARKPIN